MTIDRTLVRIERDGEWTVVEQDRIDPLFDPVVILGDPGMGKTTLLRGLCRRSGMTYVHAADLVRAGDPASLIPGDERAAVDGLDETASPGTGSAVEAVLRRLRETESPPPVLACRAAEWRDAADLARIEDAYAGKPETLYLMPFDDAEARDFLAREFPGIQVPALLQHLRNPGLAHVCRNPLVLRMFGEAIRGASALPASRTELFERACRAMAGQDSREGVIRLVRADEDDLLLAAGAICATLLLCDLAGVHDAPGAETPPGWANVTDIAGLSLAGAAAEALATRLFRAGAGGRFTFVHRALGEYLGARWLARCMDNGLSAARIPGLFEAGGGVPTALRGMHAWLARLAPALAGRCIAADPHAVLRDGETETLDLERARELLTALKERSGEDPSFDREDRGVHPAFGLMRMELKDDIVGILASPGRHAQLSACLAQAMAGTELSVEAGWTLEGILFDSARDYDERAMALLSLWVAGAHHMEAVALRLADMRDAASARLLCEAVAKEAMDAVPTSALPAATPRRPRLVTGGETVPDLGPAKADGGGVFGALDAAGLAAVLDGIASGARTMAASADTPERSALADATRNLAARVLELDPAVDAERVWTWVGWTNAADGDGSARERLAAVFRNQRALRTALLEHVLLTPRQSADWVAERDLEITGLGLSPDEDDFAALLEASHGRASGGAIDPEMRRRLQVLGLSALSSTDPNNGGAGEAAAATDETPLIEMPGWRAEDSEPAAAPARPPDARSLRRSLAGEAGRIAAGDVEVLAAPAAVYLGRFDALGGRVAWDPSASPQARLKEALGEELSERVLAGFLAVLRRNDLPEASAIARTHAAGGAHQAEAPLISGAAVALRKGLPIDTVTRATLEAAYMAWLRAPRSASDRHLDSIGSTLEAMVLQSVEDVERHFRASIEPQLQCNAAFVHDLDRLAECYRFAELAGGLSVEWLREYPALNGETQAELIACAIESAPREALRALIVDCRGKVHPNERTKLLWLSAACLVDLDGSREALLGAADHPDFLGHVREAIGGMNRYADAPLDSLVFVVQAFGARCPKTPELPGDDGKGRGWRDPRDASAFIERTIQAIANRPGPEARDALQDLIDNHAPSYIDTVRRALGFQRRCEYDFEHRIPSVAMLHALQEGVPGRVDEHPQQGPGRDGGGT